LVLASFRSKKTFPALLFPLFSPFFASFFKTNPTRFFPNPFIPQYFHIFQLGSFGRNTLFYRELRAGPHLAGLPAHVSMGSFSFAVAEVV